MQLPARLASLQLTAGTYRSGLKIIVFGYYKTGKSYLAASAPGPIFALANGEPGIIPYLDPKRGDVGLEIHSADDYYAALEFAVKHEKDFATIVSDNDTLAWAQTMEDRSDKTGKETFGPNDWKAMKKPRKAMHRRLGHGKANLIYTCYLKDTMWKKEETMPGVEGPTSAFAVELPDIEKNTLGLADLIFLTDVQKDRMQRPTNIHTVTFYGGRRPRTVSPEDLFTGKLWKFDARKPVNVWDTVIAPFQKVWVEGGEEHLGLDPDAMAQERGEMEAAYQETQMAVLLKQIAAFSGTFAAYEKLWVGEIAAPFKELPPDAKAIVRDAHERKKKELK